MSALRDDGMNRLARTVVSSRALTVADGTDAMAACAGGSGFGIGAGAPEGPEAGGEAGAAAAVRAGDATFAVLAGAVRAGDATFPMVDA